jgi:uncharacterized protein (TIGR03643 family)
LTWEQSERLITLALEERNPFEIIKKELGIDEKDVLEIMKKKLTTDKFEAWEHGNGLFLQEYKLKPLDRDATVNPYTKVCTNL